MNNQGAAQEGAIIAVLVVAFAVGLIIALVINAILCWFVSSAVQRIPAEHRKIQPGQVWLLMIPCFSLIWNFMVFQRVPESFQSYFASVGRTEHGDCGKGIGMWYSICSICSAVPFLNYIAGPAALVLLILNLVKIHQLKNELPA